MTDIVVIAGLSGAGRSHAADDLEDLGWFVVDNLPPSLVERITELAAAPGSAIERLALVAGPSTAQDELLIEVRRIREGFAKVRLLFLECATPEIVKRYTSSRRVHPRHTGDQPLVAVINDERRSLASVRELADLVIDTTGMTVHDLKSRIGEAFGADSATGTMQVRLTSFGFKNGVPLDVDIVLDVRFLPNPHWVDELRPLTGRDDAVRDYVLGQPAAREFLVRLESLLDLLLPLYAAEGKSYLTLAVGCTGGRHRSVAIVGELAGWLAAKGFSPRITHRDLGT